MEFRSVTIRSRCRTGENVRRAHGHLRWIQSSANGSFERRSRVESQGAVDVGIWGWACRGQGDRQVATSRASHHVRARISKKSRDVRKSVVSGKSVSVRVDLGGLGLLKKNKNEKILIGACDQKKIK